MNATFILQAFAAIFSMLAGIFWMSAAYGRTVGYPWKQSRPVPPAERPAHQAKWNARAALFASLAAMCQALSFLAEHYFSLLFG
jgi:hypothetical protein